MKSLTTAALLCAAAVLSGCAETAGEDAMSPTFGHAILINNTYLQGHAGTDAQLISLSNQFEAETDEVVTFAFDQATLDTTARRALDEQSRWLVAHPEVRMAIVGHTDLVGSERYNYGLGLRRAQAVLEYLVGRGVDRGRLIALESLGEQEPVVPTAERERRNRRAVTMVAGYTGEAGPGLDGIYAARIYDAYQAGESTPAEAMSTAVGAE